MIGRTARAYSPRVYSYYSAFFPFSQENKVTFFIKHSLFSAKKPLFYRTKGFSLEYYVIENKKPQVFDTTYPLRPNTGGLLWLVAIRVTIPFGFLSLCSCSDRKTVRFVRISLTVAGFLSSRHYCSVFTRMVPSLIFWPRLVIAVVPANLNVFSFIRFMQNGVGFFPTPFSVIFAKVNMPATP